MRDRRIAFRVRGVVQGVGFRYFTLRRAGRFGLVGWVQNLAGGDVVGEAQGPEVAVQAFREALEHGPKWSRVDEVDVDFLEPTPRPEEDFGVRR